ncbi:MAG: hypothetical protein OES46_10435 [Gammaproteobacteria bacterium]|jgi:hypothetical protein|nr:hypothetical protein [Gammaproteobacteria bacterium]
MPSDNDQAFTKAAKRSLDQAADNLDADTVARLHAARKRAIAAHRQRRKPRINVWVPTGALAAGLAVVVATFMWFVVPTSLPPAGIEDLELLVAHEGIEFYADLDFYDWLATQNDAG